MANALLQDLSAATTLAGTDLFYVKQSGARGVKATGTQLLALVGTAYVPLAGGTMTGALTIASGTLTASAPALSITQTWNNAAVTFKAALVNVTKLASDGAGLLQEWQLGGVSRAYVREDGVFYCLSGGYFSTVNLGTGSDGNWTATRIGLRSDSYYGIGDSTNANSATQDVRLYRDAAGSLALRNGTNQQSFSVYNTYTDSSNYERLKLTGVAGTSVNITAETLGTGGDNLDIVLTPAGTGLVKFQAGSYVDANGTFYTAGTLVAGTTLWVGATLQLRMGNAIGALWSSTANANGTVDTGLNRGAAGQVDVTNGTAATYRDLKLRNLLNVEYHQMTEMTAPSAPATNSVRIYAEDNGSGKTRLMALFATGVAQQLAIEP